MAGAALSVAPAFLCKAEAQQYTEQAVVERLASRVGESLGPHGGEVRSLVLAPTNPDRLYLGTATGHAYVSQDRGVTWRELGLELSHEAVVDNLLVHPGNEKILYAAFWTPSGTGGLVRSRDGGATWTDLPVPIGII